MAKFENRKSLVQKIHIAQYQLGFDDDTYRAFLVLHSKKDSCSKMTVPELFFVFNAFKAAGFKERKPKKPSQPYATNAKAPIMSKIGAILKDCGLSWEYAEGIADKMHGKKKLQWCNKDELHKVLTALIYHQKRMKAEGEK